jgi:hypothetical protein
MIKKDKVLKELEGCVGCHKQCNWVGKVATPQLIQTGQRYKCNGVTQFIADWKMIIEETNELMRRGGEII